MTTRLRHGLCLLALLGAGQLPCEMLQAQSPLPAASPSPAVQSLTINAGDPPLPIAKSPVALFRELLAMKTGDRERTLANRSPEIRKRILAKLQEYEAMKPEDRELRLRMTDLRWHLLRLMALPPAERAQQLALLPEADRKPAGDRLQQWDRLTADEQGEILKYEATMEQFAGQNPETAAKPLMPLVPDISINLNNYLRMPPEKRRQIYSGFQRFFELTEAEKQATLEVLPDHEREQVVSALRALQQMPASQRDQYLLAFKKFAGMSDADREEFQKNAGRWAALQPAEREAWRNLVNHVPPLPPLPSVPADEAGFPPLPPLPQPPLPPGDHLQVGLTR